MPHGPPRPCRHSRHPHHVTQRGNGRARTFFGDDDYALYRDLLAEHCRAAEVEVWAWCLMPNHVHLILVPSDPDGLRRALARVHRALCRHHPGAAQAHRPFLAGPVRRRRHGRGASGGGAALCVAQSGAGASGATRTGLALVERARTFARKDDGITALAPVRERFPRFRRFPGRAEPDADMIERLRGAESIGRPLGNDRFLAASSVRRGAFSSRRKRGPKPSRRD